MDYRVLYTNSIELVQPICLCVVGRICQLAEKVTLFLEIRHIIPDYLYRLQQPYGITFLSDPTRIRR